MRDTTKTADYLAALAAMPVHVDRPSPELWVGDSSGDIDPIAHLAAWLGFDPFIVDRIDLDPCLGQIVVTYLAEPFGHPVQHVIELEA